MSKREKWIDCGYEILVEKGYDFITIEELSSRMEISRGSFFYHFKNRDGFIRAMMERWLSGTENIIENIDYACTFDECYDSLTEFITSISVEMELKIRLWGGSDNTVKEFIEQVDRLRIDSYTKIFALLGISPEQAETYAKFRYGLMLGLKQIDNRISADDIKKSAEIFKNMVKSSL